MVGTHHLLTGYLLRPRDLLIDCNNSSNNSMTEDRSLHNRLQITKWPHKGGTRVTTIADINYHCGHQALLYLLEDTVKLLANTINPDVRFGSYSCAVHTLYHPTVHLTSHHHSVQIAYQYYIGCSPISPKFKAWLCLDFCSLLPNKLGGVMMPVLHSPKAAVISYHC